MKLKKNNWIHLAGCDWSTLLQFQPRFADKCDWSKLDGEDWAMLLRRQPRFAEKCDCTELFSLLDGKVAMLLQGKVLTDLLIYQTLNLTQLLIGYLLEV